MHQEKFDFIIEALVHSIQTIFIISVLIKIKQINQKYIQKTNLMQKTSSDQKKIKQSTPEQKKILQQKEKKNAEIVCTIMTMALGIITSPKLFSFFFQKQRYAVNFVPPSFLTFIALVSGFLFLLTILTIVLRVAKGKGLPAERQDPPAIKSVNEALKNTIIYTLVFLGLYNYLFNIWTQDPFTLHMAPFVLFGTFILEFLLRVVEFIVGAKGFRYLAHAITLFLIFVLIMEAFYVPSDQKIQIQQPITQQL